MNKDKTRTVLIVGAGISGITLAQQLVNSRYRAVLFDKSPGVGGRIATRRFEEGKWDHGIAWITPSQVGSEQWTLWKNYLRPVSESLSDTFIATEGLTFLPKKLSETFDVHKSCKIVQLKIKHNGSGWVIRNEKGNEFEGDLLILSLPAPQAIELLNNSGLLNSSSWAVSLGAILYRPQLVVLGETSPTSDILWDLTPNSPFEWVLDNGQKGILKSKGLFSGYLDEAFSRQHFDNTDEAVLEEISGILHERYRVDVVHLELKRWRYSQTLKALHEPFLQASLPAPIFFIGDGCAGGGFSGALQSSRILSEFLNSEIFL